MEFNNNNITIKEDLISANQNNEVANNPKKIYIRNKKIYLVYIVMFFTHVLLNMSNISFSAVVEKVEKDLNIGESQVGFMGTMHYIGQVSGKIY